MPNNKPRLLSFRHPRAACDRHAPGEDGAGSPVASIAALQLFAREHGLPVPNAVAVDNKAMLRVLLESVPLPVMLKADGSRAARAEIVRSIAAGIAAYHRVGGVRRLATWWQEPRHRSVFVQQYIDGVAATRSVACRDGAVLRGISVEPGAGAGSAPAATVIDHPAMEHIAALMVKTLKLSGSVDFDFVLEHGSRRAWLVAVKSYSAPAAPSPVTASRAQGRASGPGWC
jgi:hypothetical protein